MSAAPDGQRPPLGLMAVTLVAALAVAAVVLLVTRPGNDSGGGREEPGYGWVEHTPGTEHPPLGVPVPYEDLAE